jgi:hypothetical protein
MNPAMERLARGEPITAFASTEPVKEADLAVEIAKLADRVERDVTHLSWAHERYITRKTLRIGSTAGGASALDRSTVTTPPQCREASC